MLSRTDPESAARLLELAQRDVAERWEGCRALGDRDPPVALRGRGEPGSRVPAADTDGLPGRGLDRRRVGTDSSA